jgi:LmbE family N-acetylglucosaminyl deacetylase
MHEIDTSTPYHSNPLTSGRALLFSPHLDDAVLSVGGLLAERAARNLDSTVVTVFAGVPSPPYSDFAATFHTSCELADDPVGARIAEDRAALSLLGARASHGPLLDAIYRSDGGRWLYDGVGRTFLPQPAADRPVGAEVDRLVLDLVRSECPDVILGPMAFGDHVDHVLVSTAVRHAATVTGTPAFLWEDLPYAIQRSPDRSSACVRAAIRQECWRSRLDALSRYASQLVMLFPRGYDWRAAFTAYASSACGSPVERLWCSGRVDSLAASDGSVVDAADGSSRVLSHLGASQ